MDSSMRPVRRSRFDEVAAVLEGAGAGPDSGLDSSWGSLEASS